MKPQVVVSWSTGKDAAWCLHELRTRGVDVVGLVTTVTPTFDRVSVHGTRRDILRQQARGVGLPVAEVPIPYPCSNEQYEDAMIRALAPLRETGVTHMAFGDLFLEDIRSYRERLLEATDIEPLFPLWRRNTTELAYAMRDGGLEAIIVSAPTTSPVADLVGSHWDPAVLSGFPEADPCGERGEFHTCVTAAPGLGRLDIRVCGVVERDEARYADVEAIRTSLYDVQASAT